MNKVRVMKQLVGAVVTVAALGAVQAQADNSGNNYSETVIKSTAVRTQAVSYADLDTSTTDGQESLYHRISNAARKVCGSSDYRITGQLGVAADNEACYRRALNEALSQVNAGQVASTD